MMVCFLLCSDKSDTYMLSLKKSLIHAAAKPIVSSNKRGWAWLASLGYPDTTTATKSRHELPVHACQLPRRASLLPRCRSRWAGELAAALPHTPSTSGELPAALPFTLKAEQSWISQLVGSPLEALATIVHVRLQSYQCNNRVFAIKFYSPRRLKGNLSS
jgi:hypothetical protein